MSEIPHLNDWKKANPGKSINEYFKLMQETGSQPTLQNYAPPPFFTSKRADSGISILGIAGGSAGMLAYFLPMVNLHGLGGLFRVAKISLADLGVFENQAEPFFRVTRVLMVILPLLILAFSFVKLRNAQLIVSSFYVVIALYWLRLVYSTTVHDGESFRLFGQNIQIMKSNLDAGFYVAALASILIFAEVIRMIFGH